MCKGKFSTLSLEGMFEQMIPVLDSAQFYWRLTLIYSKALQFQLNEIPLNFRFGANWLAEIVFI